MGEELEPLRPVARISSCCFLGILLFVLNVVDDVLEWSALDSRVETCLSRSELNDGSDNDSPRRIENARIVKVWS